MSFCISDQKPLEKYKTIQIKIKGLLNIKLNALTIYDDRYIKDKIRTYGDEVYTNFNSLNVPENGAECESYTNISIDLLLVYEKKYYLQIYLDSCVCKLVNTQKVDYLDGNLFETDKDQFSINKSYKCYITIELI